MDQLFEAYQLVAGLLVGVLDVGATKVIQLGVKREQHGVVLVHGTGLGLSLKS
jgi:hypothetical protein